MKPRIFYIRILSVTCIVLLCACFVLYSFWRIDDVEARQEVDLYAWVPQDAVAVFETDHMARWSESLDSLPLSEAHLSALSELFLTLKRCLPVVGPSLDKVLLSTHVQADSLHQVLYCSLQSGDDEAKEALARQLGGGSFAPKVFAYADRQIHIYPLADGRFLSACFAPGFMAFSFQKRLIEQAIDANCGHNSLLHRPDFKAVYSGKRAGLAARLYVRTDFAPVQDGRLGHVWPTGLCRWMEFDVKVSHDAVVCTGLADVADSSVVALHPFLRQRALDSIGVQPLPAGTCYQFSRSFTDKQAWLADSLPGVGARASAVPYVRQRDEEWGAFLAECAADTATTLFFHPQGSADSVPCVVVRIPMADPRRAWHRYNRLLRAAPREKGHPYYLRDYPDRRLYPHARWHQFYVMPRNTLLCRLAGMPDSASHVRTMFYRGAMLLSPDVRGLAAYVESMEQGAVADSVWTLAASSGQGSSAAQGWWVADLGRMSRLPESYASVLPAFFFRHPEVLDRFRLSCRFASAEDGGLCLDLTLQAVP